MATDLLMIVCLLSFGNVSLALQNPGFGEECPLSFGLSSCDSGDACFHVLQQCDGWEHCEDGSDEENCTVCPLADYFKCPNSSACLPPELVCDGGDDCPEGSDDEEDCWSKEYEEDCRSKECYNSDDFKCESSGVCLDPHLRCDGNDDCPDGTDERHCTADDCPSPMLFCEPGGPCVPAARLCDGVGDCPDGSDETDCVCTVVEFQCENSGSCVTPSGVCNGLPDCGDASDELLCPPCHVLQLECDGKCLPKYRACNGIDDCTNGEDEINCTSGELADHTLP
ncbi:very low-density lipoprotein receptor-like [Branchiostoma floridae]|uniref:Very low-density lipoprotein receptor-like n=1 Tax=Branchiostoma floridae TaxID=7739 RepID=A0A9J7LH16_BRAFL|nr:very low-density lipoprotein receptor-like [Branchiostoma floridae]